MEGVDNFILGTVRDWLAMDLLEHIIPMSASDFFKPMLSHVPFIVSSRTRSLELNKPPRSENIKKYCLLPSHAFAWPLAPEAANLLPSAPTLFSLASSQNKSKLNFL